MPCVGLFALLGVLDRTIETWSKMKVILDGILMEKYKGDAEVASCGSLHGDGDDDNSDATTASNDEATTVTAVTRASPAIAQRARSAR